MWVLRLIQLHKAVRMGNGGQGGTHQMFVWLWVECWVAECWILAEVIVWNPQSNILVVYLVAIQIRMTFPPAFQQTNELVPSQRRGSATGQDGHLKKALVLLPNILKTAQKHRLLTASQPKWVQLNLRLQRAKLEAATCTGNLTLHLITLDKYRGKKRLSAKMERESELSWWSGFSLLSAWIVGPSLASSSSSDVSALTVSPSVSRFRLKLLELTLIYGAQLQVCVSQHVNIYHKEGLSTRASGVNE